MSLKFFKSLFVRKAADPVDPGFRKDLGFNPNPLNQPEVKLREILKPVCWIACQDAQPAPEVMVLVLLNNGSDEAIGLGIRTLDVSLATRQEKWRVVCLKEGHPKTITHWRPI